MSIRFSISATSAEAIDQDVLIDAHHISTDGEWFEHPIRSHTLRIGHTLSLLAHVALGFVLHKGDREELMLAFTHDDAAMRHGLEVVVMAAPEQHPDMLPTAVTLGWVEGDIEAVECTRLVVPPGESRSVTVYRGTRVQFHEVPMEPARHG